MMQRMMMLAALCGVLSAPACLQAQGGAGQTGAMVAPADIFNKLLTSQEKEIVDAAEAMPADKFNFAPTAGEFKGVRTFGEQVKHLTEANYGFFHDWNIPNGVSRGEIEKNISKDDIVAALRASFAYAHSAMQSITASNGLESMDEQKSTRIGTATHALAHMMDHYGQMVEYLRMNGIVPPASRKPAM